MNEHALYQDNSCEQYRYSYEQVYGHAFVTTDTTHIRIHRLTHRDAMLINQLDGITLHPIAIVL
jgi:hypothetical protein